jgi:hypothetical protein
MPLVANAQDLQAAWSERRVEERPARAHRLDAAGCAQAG